MLFFFFFCAHKRNDTAAGVRSKHLLPLLSNCSSRLVPAPVPFGLHERSEHITAKVGIFQHDVQRVWLHESDQVSFFTIAL